MKAVLISIQPKWCELIASGKKTVEVRKTRPKIETPFKCYIYQTKTKWMYDLLRKIGLSSLANKLFIAKGKVIGEFVCDEVYPIIVHPNGAIQNWNWYELSMSCLSLDDVAEYVGVKKTGFGWHISDLVIYDKPKNLNEFKKINRDCWYADLGLAKRDCPECQHEGCFMQRPPQSWCYVEELG